MKSKSTYIIYVIFFALLFLYPLRHVALGVDLMDGGYNYANFAFHDLKYMDSMWYFATWTANAFGSLLMRLPLGETMLGMNIYTGLVVSVIATGAYVFCVRRLKMPAWLVFVGELLAISLCWAPSAVLYNYLTYGLFLAATMLLYQGLTLQKGRYLVLAGAVLGMNVGVRFSNLVQVGLILAVWYYAFVCKKKFPEILQETFLCILGYAGSLGLFLATMSVRYGFGNYVEGIRRLFAMTEHATDYSALSMLLGFGKAYTENTSTYWLKRFGLAGAICLALCLLLPRGWTRAKQVLTSVITAAFMLWIVTKRYCTADYATYGSVYYPAIIVLLMAIALSLFQMLRKDTDKDEKLQAVLIPLTLYLTSLGGNNAIYSSMNNLFLVMPCFFWMALRFLKEKKHIVYFPFKTFLVAGILLLLVQGVGFGKEFVYEKATGARDVSVGITEIPVLQGMHTGAQQAENLEKLYHYLEEKALLDSECILFGDIPGIAYFMELEPAINIWSDLRSYSPDTMSADLEKLREKILTTGEYPVVMIHQKYADYYIKSDAEAFPKEKTTGQKLTELYSFLQEQKYQYAEADTGEFVVFVREK